MHSVLDVPVARGNMLSHLQEANHTGMNPISGMCPGMNGPGKHTQLGLMELDMLLLRIW